MIRIPDSTFENLPVPAFVIDARGIVVCENRAQREFIRNRGPFTDLDAIGQHASVYAASPSLVPQACEIIDTALASDGVHEARWQVLESTGIRFGTYSTVRIVEDGVVTGAIFCYRDASEEVATRKELSRAKSLFEALGGQLRDMVIFVDERGDIVECNQAAADVLGLERPDLIGRSMSEFSVNPAVAPERMRAVLEDGESRRVVVARRADGEEFWVDSHGTVIEVDNERFICLVARDATQRLQLERERETLQRLESLGVLAGGIAHDFNNLLTGIGGRLSLASSYAGGVGELPRLLAEAEAAVKQASRLTDQLLTFAKGGEPVMERVDLAALVESEVTFASSGSTLRSRLHVDDDLWAVTADPGQIRQVVNNLVINARQATQGEGSIEVVLCNVDVEADDPSALPPGRYVELRVTDDGPGIPADIIDRVFEPYFSTKDGSGLGLATVHSITARHDGLITIDSPPGSGATITIRLPAADEETIASDDEARVVVEPSTTDRTPLRVLVMDDNPSLLRLMDDMLSALGHQADPAARGEDALQLCRTALDVGQLYDAALLDITIKGGMGGLETGKALMDLSPDIPVFLMSGYSEDGIQADPLSEGFAGFIPKPFSIDDLRRTLQTLRQESPR